MSTLSRFTLNNISRVLDVIAQCNDSDTIKSLIVDLRQCCPRGSIIREVGDFIAHADAKDRGILHKNISTTFEGMGRIVHASKGPPVNGPARFSITPSFTDVEIVDSLFDVFDPLPEI